MQLSAALGSRTAADWRQLYSVSGGTEPLSDSQLPRETRPWSYLQQLFHLHLQDEAPVFHTCSSVASLLSLVTQGIGIALLPEPIVRQLLQSGELTGLDIQQPAPALSFSCSWRLDDDRILPQLLANSSREIMSDSSLVNP